MNKTTRRPDNRGPRDQNYKDGGFRKGQRDEGYEHRPNRYNHDEEGGRGNWQRQARSEEELKLQQQAQQNLAEARKSKDDIGKVRLMLNQITPDNYSRKEKELRELLFGDRKKIGEEGFDESVPYECDVEKHILIVEQLFRKA